MKNTFKIIKYLYLIVVYLWILGLIVNVTITYILVIDPNSIFIKNLFEEFYWFPKDHLLFSGLLVYVSFFMCVVDLFLTQNIYLYNMLTYLFPVVICLVFELWNIFNY